MKLNTEFFHRDCLDVAPDLVGKVIVRKFENGDLVQKQKLIGVLRTKRVMHQRAEPLERNCFTVKAE